VADALARAGQWEEARAVAEAIANPDWRAEALRALAEALINVGQIDDTVALLMRSWARAQTLDELTRLFVVDAALLRAYPTLGGDLRRRSIGWSGWCAPVDVLYALPRLLVSS
jgi:hypothetical protein